MQGVSVILGSAAVHSVRGAVTPLYCMARGLAPDMSWACSGCGLAVSAASFSRTCSKHVCRNQVHCTSRATHRYMRQVVAGYHADAQVCYGELQCLGSGGCETAAFAVVTPDVLRIRASVVHHCLQSVCQLRPLLREVDQRVVTL